jgi:aerobic carbon-monoxide dehydrogenase medium subunit
MYPPPFDYHAPKTINEAVALLDAHGDDAKVVSGGMSLLPLLKFRLAYPKHLVDLQKIPGLVGIWEAGTTLQLGGMTTHHAVATSALAKAKVPMLAEAAALIGDAQVRNRGTIGGSLAHADPSADWPAVTLALDGSVVLVGKKGERTVPIEKFITGPLQSDLHPGEIVSQVRVNVPQGRSGAAYEKLGHPASRFAIVGVAACLTLDGGKISAARVSITGVGPKPQRSAKAEAALVGQAPSAAVLEKAAGLAADGIELRADLTGSADYHAQLARVTAGKALARALARIQ